jgi:hypothetical protein
MNESYDWKEDLRTTIQMAAQEALMLELYHYGRRGQAPCMNWFPKETQEQLLDRLNDNLTQRALDLTILVHHFEADREE